MKTIKHIITIATITIMLVGAYMLGTTQAKTETTQIIPQGYIPLDKCIPLDDIASYYVDDFGYPCFELKDVKYQLDDKNNRSYNNIMNSLPYDFN